MTNLASRDIAIGEEFAGRPKQVTVERLLAFSGGPLAMPDWPRKNHHTDLEVAKRFGLNTLCASATQYQGYLIPLLIEIFGEEWLQSGTMDLRFTRIVAPGDTIQAKAIIRSTRAADASIIADLDVWCENQNGDKVLVGTATGVIRS